MLQTIIQMSNGMKGKRGGGMITLQRVTEEKRELLWNINQKYLYEMTNYYPDPMDEDGNYHYGHFEEYFTDPGREAYFLYDGNELAGFAMICPYSYIGERCDHVMAEFTVFPAMRRRHIALEAAGMILGARPGRWEIKYNERNKAARELWRRVTGPYHPEERRINDAETVLVFIVGGQ